MARGDRFLSHPFRWLRNRISAPVAPEPVETPPSPPRPRAPTSGLGGDNFYRAIWDAEVSRQTSRRITRDTGYSRQEQFQLHLEMIAVFTEYLEPDEQRDIWRGYLDSFVTGRNKHADWFREWGLDPRVFDWQAWRHAMGYGRQRR